MSEAAGEYAVAALPCRPIPTPDRRDDVEGDDRGVAVLTSASFAAAVAAADRVAGDVLCRRLCSNVSGLLAGLRAALPRVGPALLVEVSAASDKCTCIGAAGASAGAEGCLSAAVSDVRTECTCAADRAAGVLAAARAFAAALAPNLVPARVIVLVRAAARPAAAAARGALAAGLVVAFDIAAFATTLRRLCPAVAAALRCAGVATLTLAACALPSPAKSALRALPAARTLPRADAS